MPDQGVVTQNLRDFTVRILKLPAEEIVGTGLAVSLDGQVVTCAHVVRAAGVNPKVKESGEVGVYFPSARTGSEKLRRAVVAACFPNHDDDVVLLQLLDAPAPLALEQMPVLGSARGSEGNHFRCYGYRRLEDYLSGWAEGQIMGHVEAPLGRKVQEDPVQLHSAEISVGMSGSGVLDLERNLVIGVVSEKWFPGQTGKDRDTAWAVDARVLSLEPLGLPLHDQDLPKKEAPTPAPDQKAIAEAEPHFGMALYDAPNAVPEWVGRDDFLHGLDRDWLDPERKVTGLIGSSGEGKSSLARRWLDDLLANHNLPQPQGVFWWGFHGKPSVEEFLVAALSFFSSGHLDLQEFFATTAQAHLVAGMLAKGKYLLVLDGLDVFQHQEGDRYGQLTNRYLREFLMFLAAPGHQSYTLITSRAPLVDLLNYTNYGQQEVSHLSQAEGLNLLRQLGVTGADAQLAEVVTRWDGHALTLSLVGGFLKEKYGGDVKWAAELPPPEVADQGAKAKREYFRQLTEAGIDHLYEAKLLIVGEAGAGKTSLAQKIKDPAYTLRDEVSTRGIEVMPWRFLMENDRIFQVNLWDFGGQNIYQEPHQFFLTRRSLYALVADDRKEDTDFYWWLQVVELLSDNSPILIIKNEKQDRKRSINERQLREQFTNLKEILSTNLATNRGLDQVIGAIKHHIQQLPHVGFSLPRTWVKVREALEMDPRNYIGLEEYLNLCQKHGFTKREDKLQLSEYLHDLGVCLHFQKDPLLRNMLILNRTWGIDAAYRILDSQLVRNNMGRFTKNDLEVIWSEPHYAERLHELLRLMINFKLCYQIPSTEDNYIAPQLLSEDQPEYTWDATGNLLLRYAYEFMPHGILTKFIAEMHRYIAGNNLVWRGGVVLEKDQTRAEILEHYTKREITIRVVGRFPRDLLHDVIYELDKIHADIKRLKWSKLVPCNCEKCQDGQAPYFFDFEVLRDAAAQGVPQIQCQKSFNMIDVLCLIDVVMDRERFLEKEVEKSEGFTFRDVGMVVIHKGRGDVAMYEIPGKKPVKIKSAWANGSFYLFAMALVIGGLGVLAKQLPFYTLGFIIVAGVLLVPIIGALQLRQDDRLSETSFLKLMKMVIGQLPLIGRIIKPEPEQK